MIFGKPVFPTNVSPQADEFDGGAMKHCEAYEHIEGHERDSRLFQGLDSDVDKRTNEFRANYAVQRPTDQTSDVQSKQTLNPTRPQRRPHYATLGIRLAELRRQRRSSVPLFWLFVE